ncbi:amidase domain-containing protein [Ectobacillus ponti]|uniref:Amidase domain-containing protein n=1 Tax=Ectobacillus ponti TaxID=2961894 RepID=A0AA42BQF2_9BACI|nr:amidase domain-containing protein [Ectobacillus ponti]MCP8969341.1 amidase domain-containing protein [Ectobacillus ponti]
MRIRRILEELVHDHVEFLVSDLSRSAHIPKDTLQVLQRKKDMMQRRGAEIVKCDARLAVAREMTVGKQKQIDYTVHYQHLVRQRDYFYIEEEKWERRLLLESNKVAADGFLRAEEFSPPEARIEREVTKGKGDLIPYQYNRLEAVRYAEAWWNGRNPAYKNFQDNCTNFISQCLRAGTAPMNGYPNAGRGWWQQNSQWSWSWAVANSFYWYLSGSSVGLRAQRMERPEDLLLGDVIAYDFENDGRWNHTTIVTAKDANGMPLVNAHSADSRRRYWAYEDSSKYTPQMRYQFFRILDNV